MPIALRQMLCGWLGHRMHPHGSDDSVPGWLIATEVCARCGRCLAHVMPLVDA